MHTFFYLSFMFLAAYHAPCSHFGVNTKKVLEGNNTVSIRFVHLPIILHLKYFHGCWKATPAFKHYFFSLE